MRTRIVLVLLTSAALALGATSSSASAGEPTPSILSPQVSGPSIAALALANVGKGACSTNSLGTEDYGTSCTGNGGSPEYWCADFALWVWASAGVTNVSGLDAAAGSFYVYGQNNGTLSDTPAIGDAVVFDYSGGGVADHVAIVTQVNSDGTIETVSGDWGGTGSSEAGFASTSAVVDNTPAYASTVGTAPSIMGMTISGYIAPVGLAGADYGASFVSQSFPLASSALTMTAGQTIPSYIELRNTGTKAWDSNTHLGTSNPRDRVSVFADSTWLSTDRAAGVTGSVAPGDSYEFTFDLHAPTTAGTYFEYFNLVEEGVAWFSDPGEGGPSDDDLEVQIVVVDAPAPPPSPDAGTPRAEDGGAAPQGAEDSGAAATSAADAAAPTAAPGSTPPAASDPSMDPDAGESAANAETSSSQAGTSGGGCAMAPRSTGGGGLVWGLGALVLGLARWRRRSSP